MPREIRRVPADWEHPRDLNGDFEPLFDSDDEGYARHLAAWDRDFGIADKMWTAARTAAPDTKWADYTPGPRPSYDSFMPPWPDDERTHYQLYEATTEGTPLTPVCATFEEIARYAAEHNVWNMQASYEEWLELCTDVYAPSARAAVRKLSTILSPEFLRCPTCEELPPAQRSPNMILDMNHKEITAALTAIDWYEGATEGTDYWRDNRDAMSAARRILQRGIEGVCMDGAAVVKALRAQGISEEDAINICVRDRTIVDRELRVLTASAIADRLISHYELKPPRVPDTRIVKGCVISVPATHHEGREKIFMRSETEAAKQRNNPDAIWVCERAHGEDPPSYSYMCDSAYCRCKS